MKTSYSIYGLICALLVLMIGVTSGCHRQFYRQQADREAHALIVEKSRQINRQPTNPARIDLDRRSRMFNPFDLDFQPMPLDDPASHRFMQCVDGRRGYPMWHAAGLTNSVESPDWWQFLPLDEDGVLVLNAESAVKLALLHSPGYQRQLEQLYLSALDVSSERFALDTQFFAGLDSFAEANATGSSTFSFGPASNGRRDVALQRAFATGGELIVGLANNIVWQLSGPNSQSATTLIDFAIAQPLLRGAGRDRFLERLTRAERSLLANVRAFERYRRSFFLNITIGRNIESTVQRSGGVFGVGLGGFTGLGGGFAGLAGGGGGGGGFGGAGVPDAGGFLGLLQDQLQIRNLEENIARQEENLLILENTLVELLTTIPDDPEAIIRQRLQVAQARSSLVGAQSDLVGRKAGFQASLDAFARDLGLPPYVCIRIEDPILEKFELIDRKLRSRREELLAVRTAVGDANVSLLEESESDVDPDTGLPRTKIEWSETLAEKLRVLRQSIAPLKNFNAKLLNEDLPRIEKDIERFADSIDERKLQNDKLVKIYRREQSNVCTLLDIKELDEAIFDITDLDDLMFKLAKSYDKVHKRVQSYEKRLSEIDQALDDFVQQRGGSEDSVDRSEKLRNDLILASQDLLAEVGDDVLAMQLMQARARTESVVLPDVDIEPSVAFEIARKNRRDWANARASLVDAWRLIEFNADDLESSLDLTFAGSVGNVGNNPLDLRGDTGSLRLGLEWDAPITRLQERNTYRQSLIEYEQAKRNYYGFEDGIWQLLRGQIRRLQSNRISFELIRQSVGVAASQLELNEDIRSFRDARGLSSGPTAARDTIDALRALLNSQNSLLNIYVNYEVVRRGLDFDLGTMELTPEGLWIDPGKISPAELLTLPGTTSEGMINCGCTDCGIKLERLPDEPRFGNSQVIHAGMIHQ